MKTKTPTRMVRPVNRLSNRLSNRTANHICRELGMVVKRAHPGFWTAWSCGTNGNPLRDWLRCRSGGYAREIAADAILAGHWPNEKLRHPAGKTEDARKEKDE